MSCTECEELIYTFPELDAADRQSIKQHIETCSNCRLLFDDVQRFAQVIHKVNQEDQKAIPSKRLTDNVLKAIQKDGKAIREIKMNTWFDLSISRYALAAVSCGILILFFMEIVVPDLKSGKIKGPISNIQGAIIKSEDFRKVFTKPKERKSLFDECKNILSQQVDENCVKEKLSKFNF